MLDPLNVSGIGLRSREEPVKPEDLDNINNNNNNNNHDKAYDVTQFLLKMMQEDSPFFQNNKGQALPKFKAGEVSLEMNLGQGEFGVVFSIKEIRVPPEEQKEEEHQSITLEESVRSLYGERSQKHSVTVDESARTEFSNASQIYRDNIPQEQAPAGLLLKNPKRLQLLLEPNVSKTYMSTHAIRDGIHRYAIKRLRKDLKGDMLVQATADLAAEANFLTSLRHPNICRMRGTIGEPGTKGFAIVLDRLTLTLREKMMEWKKLDGAHGSSSIVDKIKSLSICGGEQIAADEKLEVQKEVFSDKLMAVYDIARALRHLAENSVIYRDLKPENIGIDLRGDLRLFDFGLAKELKEKDMVAPGMYKLTGMTGSRRYMAPEVIQSKDYGLSADVYAYSILFWEVMSNRNAYNYLNLEKHYEMVVTRRKRPNLKQMVPKKLLPVDSNLHTLVKECWAHKPQDRPSIQKVCEVLFGEITTAQQEEKAAVDRSKHLRADSLRSRLDDGEPLWC